MVTSSEIVVMVIITLFLCASAQEKVLGDPCAIDAECVIENDSQQRTVWCHGKQCVCRSGYKRQNNICVIGGDCTKDEECEHLENSFCNTKMRDRAKCVCKEKFAPGANNTKCLRVTSIGSPCTSKDDCSSNYICRDRVCTCSDISVPTDDGTTCIPRSGHNDLCQLSRQCNYSENAACIRGRCSCVDGYTYNETHCTGVLGLGDPCDKDLQCFVPNDPGQKTVWCHGNQCSCKDGYKREEDKCVIGGDCTKDEECQHLENSFCNTKMRDRSKCVCKEMFVSAANSTKCLPVVNKVGEGCQHKDQCTANLGKSDCVSNKCICEKGVNVNREQTKCGAPVSTVISIACLGLLVFVKLL